MNMMKILMKSVSTGMIAANMAVSTAHANRITVPNDPAARCTANVPGRLCRPLTDQALATGCVTQDEYNTLLQYGSYPSCSPDPENPGKWLLLSWCKCGCFHPDTEIMALGRKTDSRSLGAFKASTIWENAKRMGLVSMTKDSRVSNPVTQYVGIRTTTTGPEKKPLVRITTGTGEVLRVTAKHAVLKADGTMVQAESLRVGDQLVLSKGQATKVTAIGAEPFRGNVINFATEASNPLEHIIIAEDLFVGDLLWQSSLDDLQNQVIIRQ